MKEFFSKKKSIYSIKPKNHYKKTEKSNPYLNEVIDLRKTIPEWDNFFSDESSENRDNNWVRLEVLGQPLTQKYSWAIPDERALKILASFSPLVEIGGGKGYWASLLQKNGVDIVTYDIEVDAENSWTDVLVGGPKKLQHKSNVDRTLFLCYPDEAQNMSVKCLKYYTGEYIVHVGELLMTGTLSGFPQAPFGRTSSSEFNVLLAENFHCVLSASLPKFPFSNDCITVWQRTKWVKGRSLLSEEEDDDQEENEEETEDFWADIPVSERMPQDRAAPCMQHLLH